MFLQRTAAIASGPAPPARASEDEAQAGAPVLHGTASINKPHRARGRVPATPAGVRLCSSPPNKEGNSAPKSAIPLARIPCGIRRRLSARHGGVRSADRAARGRGDRAVADFAFAKLVSGVTRAPCGARAETDGRQTMRLPIALALLAIVAFAVSPAAAEHTCRPSLSNLYHCPGTSAPATSTPAAKTAPTASTSGRACKPSVSNLWTCPGSSQSRSKSASSGRACRPSLSNGYSCPGTSSGSGGSTASNKASPPKRACRPSLSNGYNCEGQAGADQYSTEMLAWAHCPTDTVVWANTASDIYHFHGTPNYGTTKAGAYMCEQESRNAGMRAAKNEKHP